MMHNAERLPDSYRKDKESNNYKLLELNSLAVSDLKEEFRAIIDSLDIEKAEGKTLDLFGQMLDQNRGLLNDTQYKYMLYTRIGRNVSRGDYKSIMDVIVRMFNTEHGNVVLDDFSIQEADEPCKVRLAKFPLFVLVEAGFSSRQAVQ